MEDDDSESGVSPVVGVILVVAITVILSAVVFAFVTDIGGNTSEPGNADVEVSSENGELVIRPNIMDESVDQIKVRTGNGSETEVDRNIGQVTVLGNEYCDASEVTVIVVVDGEERVVRTYDGDDFDCESNGGGGVSDDGVLIDSWSDGSHSATSGGETLTMATYQGPELEWVNNDGSNFHQDLAFTDSGAVGVSDAMDTGGVRAYDDSGTVQWYYDGHGPDYVTVDENGDVYATDNGSDVTIKVNSDTGDLAWEKSGNMPQAIAAYNGTAVFVMDNGTLERRGLDGSLNWSVDVFDGSAPNSVGVGLVADEDRDRLIIANKNGTVYSYAPDGTEQWEQQVPFTQHDDAASFHEPTVRDIDVADDGTIYIGAFATENELAILNSDGAVQNLHTRSSEDETIRYLASEGGSLYTQHQNSKAVKWTGDSLSNVEWQFSYHHKAFPEQESTDRPMAIFPDPDSDQVYGQTQYTTYQVNESTMVEYYEYRGSYQSETYDMGESKTWDQMTIDVQLAEGAQATGVTVLASDTKFNTSEWPSNSSQYYRFTESGEHTVSIGTRDGGDIQGQYVAVRVNTYSNVVNSSEVEFVEMTPKDG